MEEAEARMQCKVRGKGPDGNPRDQDRLTGEMIYSTFVHRESRPIQGRTCPIGTLTSLSTMPLTTRSNSDGKPASFVVSKPRRPGTKRLFITG